MPIKSERNGRMENKKQVKRKAFILQSDCVACGCCMKVCPKNAIQIASGVMAEVDMNKCVGCGKCVRECPASVVELREVQA